MATPFDTRLVRVVKSSLTDTLKPLGFRKRGVVYRRQVGGLQWLIDVQKSGFNSKEKASFTLNLGVFVPGLWALYSGRSEPADPQVPECCIYGRVGQLTPDKRDHWWDLRPDDPLPAADERMVADVRRRLVDYAVPFLEQFHSRRDVMKYLEAQGKRPVLFWPPSGSIRLIYLAILHHLDGDLERCRELVAEAQTQSVNKPNREHIATVAERLYST